MDCRFLNSISDIEAESWDSICNTDYPFLRHAFLSALELSKSACKNTGWEPHHLVVYKSERLIALMPLYIKYHSYGEYIFDWNWAHAYERHGLSYYPKLLSAIPFTPATGPRLVCATDVNAPHVFAYVSDYLKEHARQLGASSIHILATNNADTDNWDGNGLSSRSSCQFHWFNDNYTTFDNFLARFTSRKRKNLNKERRRIFEQGISMHRYTGEEITTSMWDIFYKFYQITYAKRSGHGGYLRREFFEYLHSSMSNQTMLVLAEHQGRYVAGALYFFDSKTLYGRYWGCTQEFEVLHFEACYYQGIEFCIEQQLERFDAGAQGEHKIQRGFTPVEIFSNHWISDTRFRAAIDDFLEAERKHNFAYIAEAQQLLPYKDMT